MIQQLTNILNDGPHDKFDGHYWYLLSEEDIKELIQLLAQPK